MSGLQKLWGREPVMVLAFIDAIIVMLIAFGLTITPDQKSSIDVVLVLLIGLITRSQVYPVSKVENNTSSAVLKAIQAGVVILAISVAGIGASACGPAYRPPNLTPEAITAFDNTRLQGALDQIRDIVHVANAQTPPVISTDDARKVTEWHRSAIITLHARAAGWQATTKTGLEELLKNVDEKTRVILQPYVALAETIIDQVK